jgi:hypothetical protein
VLARLPAAEDDMKTMIRLLAMLVMTLSIPRVQWSAQRLTDQITFKNVAMGELSDEDGVHLEFTTFSASDGQALWCNTKISKA